MEYLLHTPEGVRDLHDAECEKKLLLEEKLLHSLHLFGFRDISTPTFEYFDIFSKERGTVPSKDMYKFFDKEGNTLVLRPDLTPQIARCVAKYYKDEKNPIRLCYHGNSFVNHNGYRGKLKEMTQIGAELIEDSSILADAEMVALMAECLKATGLTEFQIEIGHVGFFSALALEAGLSGEEAADLRKLIESKNLFSVEQMLQNYPMNDSVKDLLLKLPEFFGNIEKMKEIYALTQNENARKALSHLFELHRLLTEYDVAQYISYDLGMLGQYGYYTGINFRALTFNSGESVAAGGRYDHLVGQFGKEAPAIGIALYVDALLLAQKRQGVCQKTDNSRVLLVYSEGFQHEVISMSKGLRKAGVYTKVEKRDNRCSENEYRSRLQNGGITEIRFIEQDGCKIMTAEGI